jgi:multidrug efflux pump subunit AcrA (membrane-fusion protein)
VGKADSAPTFAPPATAIPGGGETYTVKQRTIEENVEARGRVVAKQETPLIFPLSGVLKAVYVGPTDRVEAGALLAELDTPELERQVVDRELDLATAKLNSQKAQNTARAQEAIAAAQLIKARAQYGGSPNLGAQAELQIAEMSAYLLTTTHNLDVDIARARVDWAQARLALASEQLSSTSLKAPFTGVIISIEKGPGDPVEAYEPIGLIADASELRVVASVFDDVIDRVTVGQPVTVRLAAYPERTFSGSVLWASSETSIWRGHNIHTVTVVFDNWQDVPGIFHMSAEVSISGRTRKNTLVVPSHAIITIGGRTYVERIDAAGQVERVEVQTGVSIDNLTEITRGLAAGQVIRIP